MCNIDANTDISGHLPILLILRIHVFSPVVSTGFIEMILIHTFYYQRKIRKKLVIKQNALLLNSPVQSGSVGKRKESSVIVLIN